MRFCLEAVDKCVVLASVEQERYAETYGVTREKFVFVPYHHTLKKYHYEVGDDGYVFTGGNADRDFRLFFDSVRELNVPCILATNRLRLLAGLVAPSNVKVVSVSPSDFRQLMARARVVVMPMRATLLHAGAQQSMLNAMLMSKPVVLTDPEGGADYIEHGKTGLLVPYGDVAALRQAICFLLEHPQEARTIGERAKVVAASLTTERCNTEIWKIALGLVAGRASGSLTPEGGALGQ
jgi:glycosyltransferase involved in cell wall biosynthesis